MTAKAPATRILEDAEDFDHAEFDALLRRLADVVSVPYQQLKTILEQGALVTRLRPRRERYEYLRGVKITISQAAKKYNTPGTTLRGWISHGYIAVLDTEHPKHLDEADVVFCVAVKAERERLGITAKVPFFDDANEPVYQAKYEANLLRRRREILPRGIKSRTIANPALATRMAAPSSSTGARKAPGQSSNRSRRP